MANRDVIALGTSAGGVEALMYLARRLRADLPAAVLVTIHLPSQFRSSLDELLSAAGPLPASFAADGMPLHRGRIYIAPPDRHLLIEHDKIRLGTGPLENNARPAIDPMLRSAALCCCGRSIGVVLTGTLGDGASGLWAVSQCGGTTVVQDPRGAAFPEMPQRALGRLQPDYVVSLERMPALLTSLAQQPAAEPLPLPANIRDEVEIAGSGRQMSSKDRTQFGSLLSGPPRWRGTPPRHRPPETTPEPRHDDQRAIQRRRIPGRTH